MQQSCTMRGPTHLHDLGDLHLKREQRAADGRRRLLVPAAHLRSGREQL